MSKILSKEIQDVLGVSKNNANAFVEGLSKKYLIDLVPLEDLKEINETAGTIGSPLTEEEKVVLDQFVDATVNTTDVVDHEVTVGDTQGEEEDHGDHAPNFND